ncbi:hypothetical protein BT96DRAFT_984013 [Gymnopus androsaceus JB14]|uniref:C2H2-type domain-containing protein n=1 Tax=Gymnopus androsaceus JB14 TaxID=1447944 RepID=A0A6A4IDZ8_9AGAR|nr:hypothetical protein BT96DRAFT_984013 [Gymnopus androsaceus JB14]
MRPSTKILWRPTYPAQMHRSPYNSLCSLISVATESSSSNMKTVVDHPNSPSGPDVDVTTSRLEHHMAIAERKKPFQNSYENFSRSKSDEISLGKFTGTTATFSWPSLMPSSRLEQPRMFRNLEKASFTTYRQPSESRTWSSSSGRTSPALTSSCTTPVSESASLKRSRSESEDDGESHSDIEKPPGSIRIIRKRKELFNDIDFSPSPPNATDITPSSHSTPIIKRASPRKTPPPRIITDFSSSAIERTSVSSPVNSVDQLDAGKEKESFQKTNWEKFAAQIEKNEFRCCWGGCDYTAKKQLVKRHIETTHMKLKPFACRFCSSRFPQKTSLNVHVASKHTRDNPYKCPFDGCQRAFNDPARLHRHKTDVHNYVPKPTTRCKKRSRGPSRGYEIVPFAAASSQP